MRALIGACIATSLLMLGSCVLVYPSEFHVVFDAEPETARQAVAIEIEVHGPEGTPVTEPLRFPLGEALDFPTEPLSILPEGGDWRRTFTVVARVLRPNGDGLEVFNERSFRSTFAAPGRDGRQTHRLVFSDDCILFNRVCSAGETCIDGRCAPIPFEPPETRRDEPLRVVAVANVEALTDAVAAARFGDVIELEPGTYEVADNLVSQAAGSDGAPIVVRAREPGTARLRFVGPRIAEVFLVRHPYWVIEGLEIEGACETDDTCEHAVHVTGAATHTILRRNRFIDFNQAIHVNADSSGARPDDGRIEHNEIFLTRVRDVGIRVTGLRLAHASRWVVRGNVFRDLVHASNVAYAAFMDEGGEDGRFEGNLVRCRDAVDGGGPRSGLSIGTSGAGILHTRARFENDIVLGCDSSIVLRGCVDCVVAHATVDGEIRLEINSSARVEGSLTAVGVTTAASARLDSRDNVTVPLEEVLSDVPRDLRPVATLGPRPGGPQLDFCGDPRRDGAATPGALEPSASCTGTWPPGAPR